MLRKFLFHALSNHLTWVMVVREEDFYPYIDYNNAFYIQNTT